ncbi:hypothetical protein TRVL_10041 [Trypanosoma vivax]|nr:hypothetical protein TRVL_10041 [Trypanosoma vivax]
MLLVSMERPAAVPSAMWTRMHLEEKIAYEENHEEATPLPAEAGSAHREEKRNGQTNTLQGNRIQCACAENNTTTTTENTNAKQCYLCSSTEKSCVPRDESKLFVALRAAPQLSAANLTQK